MADAFLIIVTVVLAVLLIYVNFYLLALYCHRKRQCVYIFLYRKLLSFYFYKAINKHKMRLSLYDKII
jgi:hypothetical protein